MNSTNTSTAIKRVYKDLKELEKNPITGISLCLPCPSDPFTIHANLEIKSGIYEGILLHLIVHIPPDYPINAPAVNIAPGLNFGHRYHAHIFDDYLSGNSICTDITSNFMGHFRMIDGEGKPAKSGWTSAYTLSSVLLQLQVFFSEPDLSESSLPSKEDIEALRTHIKNYELEIVIEDDDEKKTVVHSYAFPYPYLELTTRDHKIELSKVIQEKTKPEASDSLSNRSLSTKAEDVHHEETKIEEEKPVEKEVVNHWGTLQLRKKVATDKKKLPSAKQVVVIAAPQIQTPVIEDKPTPKIQSKRNNQRPNFNTPRQNQAWQPRSNPQQIRTQAQEVSYKKEARVNLPPHQVSQEDREEVKVENESAWSKKIQKHTGLPSSKKTVKTTITQISNSANTPAWRTPEFRIQRTEKEIKIRVDSDHKSLYDPDLYKIASEKIEDPKAIQAHVSERLLCSVFKNDLFDESKPIFGYPIDLEKDQFGRFWPTPVMEILSYDAFVQTIQQNFEKLDNYHSYKFRSSFGNSYNYWLPIYVNEEHFQRSKQHILNSIAVICTGIEGKSENDFKPEMILKVLPAILVKTFIHFLRGTVHQSIVGIEAYCQFYRLFVKLIGLFPELKTKIDQEVASFMKSEDNRHKSAAGDLGEFMVKMALSSYGINNKELNMLLFNEHLARQVRWCIRADKSLGLKERCPDFVQKFVRASKVSDQFHLIQLEMARLLLDDEVEATLDKRCGYLDDERMGIFLGRIDWIKKNIGEDWSEYVQSLGLLGKIGSERVFKDYILKAFEMSALKQYF